VGLATTVNMRRTGPKHGLQWNRQKCYPWLYANHIISSVRPAAYT